MIHPRMASIFQFCARFVTLAKAGWQVECDMLVAIVPSLNVQSLTWPCQTTGPDYVKCCCLVFEHSGGLLDVVPTFPVSA